MIIIPSGTGIPCSRLHLSTDQDSPNRDAGDDDDIHICGSCKEQFIDIFLFMRHKSDSNCKSRLGKKLTQAAISSESCSTASDVIFNPLGGAIRSVRPETKYTRVSLINTEAFTIEKESSPKEDSPSAGQEEAHSSLSVHPPHLLLADVASQQLSIQNQDETNGNKTTTSDMSLEDDWDSSWSAAKVLGTFSISNSLRKLQNQNLSLLKESDQIQGQGSVKIVNVENNNNEQEHVEQQQHDQRLLQTCGEGSSGDVKHKEHQIHVVEDSQIPERFVGPDGGLLDVEDVEVATLLANHLANEPSLHIYPNASDAFLSYGNVQNQLVIPTSTDTLNFANQSDSGNVFDSDGKKCVANDESLLSQNQYISKSPVKAVQVSNSSSKVMSDKSSKSNRKRKVHSCPNEGCKFQGNSVRDLNRHIRKHTGERPFKCTECEKTFTRRDKLTLHLRCHGGGKTYQCTVCEFSCRDQSGLVIHMRRHNDERPYKCQICEHRARTKSHLNVHLRKHTGDHPYKCKKCGRAFTTGSDLTRHSRLHSGDKPYSCPHCSYSAALKTSLRTHIQQNHLSGVSLVCPKCNLEFQSRKDLRDHLKTHKDDPKRCSKCDFIGSTNTALKNHLKVHEPERVKQSPLLNGKRGSHRFHQKKRFSPKKQKKSMEGFPEVHNCAYCNASFWREDTLEEHVRQHQLEELVSARAPAPQDPVLADSADSRDSTDSTSMDVTCGLAGLAALASYHSASEQVSSEQQPAFLYRYISGSQSNDNLRNAEILASLNQSSGNLPQYVAIQTDQNTLVDALNCIQYVLPSPLGTLDDNDNATSLLC